MTTDYKEGIKRDVAEIKFLIHDLRVERFINEIIHFHVTVNTDLEIYSLEQAQIMPKTSSSAWPVSAKFTVQQ